MGKNCDYQGICTAQKLNHFTEIVIVSNSSVRLYEGNDIFISW